MNSRELALVSTATVFGALASALAFRFFLIPKSHFSRTSSSRNGVVSNKSTSRSPFDPSKRQGSVLIPIFVRSTMLSSVSITDWADGDCCGLRFPWMICSNYSLYVFFFFCVEIIGFILFHCLILNADIFHGMIILWQLHFCQLRDPKILTGRSYIKYFRYALVYKIVQCLVSIWIRIVKKLCKRVLSLRNHLTQSGSK